MHRQRSKMYNSLPDLDFQRLYMGFIDSIRNKNRAKKTRDCKRAKGEEGEGAQMIAT